MNLMLDDELIRTLPVENIAARLVDIERHGNFGAERLISMLFAFSGDVEEDLLNITAVHPMREDAVQYFLERANSGWPVIRRLIAQGRLVEIEHAGHMFYLRRLC